ncbi:MAG: glycosyltransferase family 2 protein [Bacteroidales bacterium]
MNLSVAIITYNEEQIIKRTLEAVNNIADEIIIVDSYSTDKTEEICKGFPKVKFLKRKFDGYGTQKNYTIERCSGKWILFVDADEVLDELLQKSVYEMVSGGDDSVKVYNSELHTFFLGKILKYGGWGKTFRERLFMKGYAKYSEDIVHEKFITKANNKGRLNGTITHYTYRNINHHIDKTNVYTSMMAQKMYEKGKKASFLTMYIKPKFQFFKTYVLRLGFLDGLVGYYIAKTAAFYTLLKYSKLYELQNKE